METLGKQLLGLRKRNGLTQIQVAEYLNRRGLNVRNNYVSRWEQNKIEPSIDQFLCLCELYGVKDVLGTFWQVEHLPKINEQGWRFIHAITEMVEKSGLYAPKQPLPYTRPIRVYETPASAGTGEFLADVDYQTIYVDDTVPLDADFGLPLAGNSMEPRFSSGEVVWVHEQSTLDNGQIGVFSLNGDAYIKMLETGGGKANLVSLNKEYAPIEVMEDDTLHVFGKVVGKTCDIDVFGR